METADVVVVQALTTIAFFSCCYRSRITSAMHLMCIWWAKVLKKKHTSHPNVKDSPWQSIFPLDVLAGYF